MNIKNYLHTEHTSGPSHKGQGQISDSRLWDATDFSTNLQFVIHSVLGPGSSIGTIRMGMTRKYI